MNTNSIIASRVGKYYLRKISSSEIFSSFNKTHGNAFSSVCIFCCCLVALSKRYLIRHSSTTTNAN